MGQQLCHYGIAMETSQTSRTRARQVNLLVSALQFGEYS
jgi:hypothetical protein